MMGKRMVIFVPLLILFAVLQTSMFPKMMILNVVPNVVLVTVCTIAYFFGSEEYETGEMNMHLEILRGKGFIFF